MPICCENGLLNVVLNYFKFSYGGYTVAKKSYGKNLFCTIIIGVCLIYFYYRMQSIEFLLFFKDCTIEIVSCGAKV